MKIPGTNINVSRQKAPAPLTTETIVRADSANSYEDSVAKALADKFGSGSVKANGRYVGTGYSAEDIADIYSGYIFAAIRKTRNKVADILVNNIEVYDPKAGNPKDAPKLDGVRHPYMDAIDNATMDNTLFYAGIASFIMILGEAFVDAGERTMVAGNIKPTTQFKLLQSNQVVRTYDDDGKQIKTYKETIKLPNGLDDITHYVPSNVVALTDLNPTDLRKGYGMIRPVVDETSLEKMATKLQIATLSNMLKAPGSLSTKEKVEKDDWDNLKAQVLERYTSNDMDKAGTPLMSNGGFIQYESLIEDLDKLAMQKIRSLNRDAFFAVLGVSKTILGIEESGTTRDVSRTQTENFILDTVMPLVNSIINGFNQDYINNYPVDYAKKPLKMRAVAPIEKDMEQEKAEAEVRKAQAEAFKTLVDAGMHPDQAAKVAGIELEGDQKVMIVAVKQNNKIELTPEQLASLQRNFAAAAPAPVIHNHNDSHVHHHDPADTAEVAKNGLTDKEQAKLNKAETTLRAGVRELDTALGDKYVSGLNQLNTDDQNEYIDKLAKLLVSYYVIALPIFGKNRALQIAEDYTKSATPFTMSEVIKEAINARMVKVSNAHFATIDSELTKVISDATRDNTPRADVVKLVREKVSNDVAGWQVDRLVDTETSEAFRQSTYYADKQFIDANGYAGRAYKVWQTNSPDPCPFCAGQNGRRVPFEDNFFNVGDVVEGETTMADGKSKQVYYPVRFVESNAAEIHPHGKCTYRLVIERA